MGPHITALQFVELSARAKCSVQTTKRAYSGANVSPFNRARIVDAARELGLPAPPEAAPTQKGAAA